LFTSAQLQPSPYIFCKKREYQVDVTEHQKDWYCYERGRAAGCGGLGAHPAKVRTGAIAEPKTARTAVAALFTAESPYVQSNYSVQKTCYICCLNFFHMPSFDIASKVDLQTLDNAINTVKKEITNRFDFKNAHVVIEINKKEYTIALEADSDMKIEQMTDVIISRSMKQGIDAAAFDFSKEPYPSGKIVKKEVSVKNGLKQEDAKKIVKLIKDGGFKVQAAIMDNIVRVTGKKIDDLQQVIAACRTANLGLPLQFENMKS